MLFYFPAFFLQSWSNVSKATFAHVSFGSNLLRLNTWLRPFVLMFAGPSFRPSSPLISLGLGVHPSLPLLPSAPVEGGPLFRTTWACGTLGGQQGPLCTREDLHTPPPKLSAMEKRVRAVPVRTDALLTVVIVYVPRSFERYSHSCLH